MKKLGKILIAGLSSILIVGSATIKDIDTTETGTLITFRDNTGYYIEK